MEQTLTLEGISDLELMELEEVLPKGSVSQSGLPEDASDRYGDLGLTAAIVIVSIAAIDALAIWMAKRQIAASDRERVRYKRSADGSVEIELDSNRKMSASDELSEKLYKANRKTLLDQLKSLANVDLPG